MRTRRAALRYACAMRRFFVLALTLLALVACAPVARDESGLQTLEIVTGGARAEDALPIVVAVHGLGDAPRGLAGLFADMPLRARVLLPQAPERWNAGYSWFPLPWDAGGEAPFVAGLARSRDRLIALLESLARARPEAGLPVLTGFSQGGMLSFAVGVARPELVARVIPVAGWLPDALVPERAPGGPRTPLRALHGEEDGLLRFEPTRRLVARLAELGFDAQLRGFPGVGHTVPREMQRALWDEIAQGLSAPRPGPAAAVPPTR